MPIDAHAKSCHPGNQRVKKVIHVWHSKIQVRPTCGSPARPTHCGRLRKKTPVGTKSGGGIPRQPEHASADLGHSYPNTLSAGNVSVGAGSQLVLGNGGSALSVRTLTGGGTLTMNKTDNQDMSYSLNATNAFDITGTLSPSNPSIDTLTFNDTGLAVYISLSRRFRGMFLRTGIRKQPVDRICLSVIPA